jgi:hypothetical protein
MSEKIKTAEEFAIELIEKRMNIMGLYEHQRHQNRRILSDALTEFAQQFKSSPNQDLQKQHDEWRELAEIRRKKISSLKDEISKLKSMV